MRKIGRSASQPKVKVIKSVIKNTQSFLKTQWDGGIADSAFSLVTSEPLIVQTTDDIDSGLSPLQPWWTVLRFSSVGFSWIDSHRFPRVFEGFSPLLVNDRWSHCCACYCVCEWLFGSNAMHNNRRTSSHHSPHCERSPQLITTATFPPTTRVIANTH